MKSVQTEKYAVYNGDCVEIISQMPSNSVHFEIFSPPFANLYIYSDDLRDMGNCKNEVEFFKQFDYLIPELYRVLMNGRICAVHCKQIARYKNSHGASGWYDFRGDIIRHFESVGFQYHSEVVIWTDPVLEMQKTKTQRLLYCQLQRDSSLTGVGMPEYLVLFRKWDGEGKNSEPIRHYKDEKSAEKENADKSQIMDLEVWQRYASPVWFDIRRTDVLNSRIARSDKDEKHICPLQLGVIERAIELWTNPGDIVLDPFDGIGSTGYQAIKQNRRHIGCELKEEYFDIACRNIADAENELKVEENQISFFDEL